MVLAFYENVDIPERRLAGVAMAACKKAFEKAKRWRRRRNESGKESRTSWAVIATDDKAFDQRMLQAMAKRIGATVTEVAASHAVFMTQPKVVADVIDEAARKGSVEAR